MFVKILNIQLFKEINGQGLKALSAGKDVLSFYVPSFFYPQIRDSSQCRKHNKLSRELNAISIC